MLTITITITITIVMKMQIEVCTIDSMKIARYMLFPIVFCLHWQSSFSTIHKTYSIYYIYRTNIILMLMMAFSVPANNPFNKTKQNR